MTPLLRHARAADLPSITATWVDAFDTDPFFRWIQPDPDRFPAYCAAWLRFIAELALERGNTFLAPTGEVAIAWIPPDLSLVGPEDIARGHALIAEHAGEAKADDVLTTIVTARGHAPAPSHWTLQYVGIRTAAQGRGLGAKIASPTLRMIDEEQLPCWLISTNPRNVAFYERLGFAVTAEVSSPDGAVTLRSMLRPAAT